MNRRPRSTRRARTGGLTLVEIIIATSVLVVGLTGLVAAILSATRLRQMNAEYAKARAAAESTLSAIRGMPGLLQAYDRFGGGGDHETFAVQGLAEPSPGEPAGRVIVWRRKSALKNDPPPAPDPASTLPFPQDEILAAQQAFSTTFPAPLESSAGIQGTGWNDFLDTNGDGIVDGADAPRILPVTVRIRWRSRSGVVTRYFSTVVGRR